MSDREDPMLTIGPQAAREARPTPRKTTLDLGGSIQATHDRREGSKEGVSPTTLFVFGIIRNFLLGIPLAGMGFVFAYKAMMRLDKHLGTEAFAIHDLIPFIPPFLLLAAGVAFIAPAQAESVARFIGLGGIVDKLPFIKKAA